VPGGFNLEEESAEVSTKKFVIPALAGLLLSSFISLSEAQEKPSTPPQLVTFWGAATGLDGKPRTGTAGVTFSIYKEQQGGAPLWMETQNVALDVSGGYSAQIGATNPEGLPIGLFSSGEARWLEVQVDGQPPAQRVLLVSVPYALKAVDAQTLGGLPASAFALAGTIGTVAPGARASVVSAASPTAHGAKGDTAQTGSTITGTGTAGYVPLFTGASTIGNSAIVQKSGNVGIGVSPSGFKLEVSNADDSAIFGTTASSTGYGVEGYASASSGNTFGVFGTTASPSGVGVEGSVEATTGDGAGVFGTTASTSGLGVKGDAAATSGATYGVDGIDYSSDGVGVQGHAYSASGSTIGVNGISDSDAGVGTEGSASTTSGTTFGVAGTSASSAGTGVQGYVNSTTGNTFGVVGIADSTSGIGTEGTATSATGTTYGVYGSTASSAGTGVYGDATSVTGTNYGVYGNSDSPTGYGVTGSNSASSGTAIGVFGSVTSSSGYAVMGQALATSGSTYGVRGKSYSTAGTGVLGLNAATTGINYGVAGNSVSSQGIGVYGYATAPSTLGGQLAIAPAGVWGDTHAGSVGVLATSDSSEAIAAYNNASNVATLFVENQTDNSDSAIVVATYSDYGGFCDIFVNGNLSCSGSVGGHAVISDAAGASRDVALYSMQAPENWFEDIGSGQLRHGAAVVNLEAEYAQAANTGMEYHVFLTPKGDCKGLYVSNETGSSFEVHELGGGSSSIGFDYRIVARRKGYENIRMADLTDKIQRGPKAVSGVRTERAVPGTEADTVHLPSAPAHRQVAKAPIRVTAPGH
jgi:hypothetical protein